MHNITLRNIQQYGTLLPPGIIRCNSTNPCTGFVFENVRAHGWWRLFGLNYIVESVEGVVTDSKPDPGFSNSLQTTNAAKRFDLTTFAAEKVYPLFASVIEGDKSYQAKLNQVYLSTIQSYSQVYSQFAR